jgi:hypothetical protein
MAAAIGQTIDIPVVIRSLSRDFYRSAARNNYSIPLDRSFLLAMDAGITTATGQMVDQFECAWWIQDNLVAVDAQFLNHNNIDLCLVFHRLQISLLPISETPHLSHSNTKPFYIWKPDAAAPITETDSCKRCRLYRAVAMGTMDEHRDIRNQIQAMEATFTVHKKQAIRRASGFNHLFEFLSIKEQDSAVNQTAGNTAAASVQDDVRISNIAPEAEKEAPLPPIPSKKSKKGRRIVTRRAVAAAARDSAIAEVDRIQNLPCLKWTWGVDMDASDIPAFRRSADHGNILPHSGYDTSLSHGSETRTSSSSLPREGDSFGSDYFSDISNEAIRPVPDLNPKDIPPYHYELIQETLKPSILNLRETDEPVHSGTALHGGTTLDSGTAETPLNTHRVPPPPPLYSRSTYSRNKVQC